MNEPIQRPLTLQEAALFLGLKEKSLYGLVFHKKITAYKPGGKRLLFKLEDLEAYAYRNKKSADFELMDQADKVLTKTA